MTGLQNRRKRVQPHRKKRLALASVFAVFVVAGCSNYPQAQSDNRALISSLRTALSTEQPEWLEQNVAEIDIRFKTGKLTQEEYDAFQSIIEKAKAGDWDGAEVESVAFQRAQVRMEK